MTYLGEYFRVRLAAALTPEAAARMTRLHPGVDVGTFRPDPRARAEIRERYGLGDRPVVVCVSRLVPRKGQDTLLRAWPAVLAAVPDAALLIVSGGPYAASLHRLAEQAGVASAVRFTGPVPQDELPAHYAAGDVFAMPCRTRRGGLDVEGLGIVYLEASATGLPVVGGDSGGAPDAILDGETGYVVGGRDVGALSARLIALLTDPAGAKAMGEKGRAWVERDWNWDLIASRLRSCSESERSRRYAYRASMSAANSLASTDALDAELGGQVALLLGEVPVEYAELPDRLRPGHRLVRVVDRRLDLGVQVRVVAQVGDRGRRPACRAAAFHGPNASGSIVTSTPTNGRPSPTTMHCEISACIRIRSSSTAGATFLPPAVTIISFFLPVMVRKPSSSSSPMSPVAYQPSAVNASLVAVSSRQ